MIAIRLTHFRGYYHVQWTENGRERSRSLGIRVGVRGGGRNLHRAQLRAAAIAERLNHPDRVAIVAQKREEREVRRLNKRFERMRERDRGAFGGLDA